MNETELKHLQIILDSLDSDSGLYNSLLKAIGILTPNNKENKP